MFVDEKIALLEKIITGSQEISKKDERWKMHDIVHVIKNNLSLPYKDIELEFETKQYFDNKITLIQIKDFYEEMLEDKLNLCMSNPPYRVSSKIKILSTTPIKFEQWIMKFMEKIRSRQWQVMIQKYRNLGQIEYCCCDVMTASDDFYNILFQVCVNEINIKGIYSCSYYERKTMGILLEALLLESFTHKDSE